MAQGTGQPGQGRLIELTTSELKLCELCGWLNLDSNSECFVCGWHGKFNHDSEAIKAAVELAIRRHGRLELEHLTDVRTYRQPKPKTLKAKFLFWLHGFLRRIRRK
jgi:hypothetical protein